MLERSEGSFAAFARSVFNILAGLEGVGLEKQDMGLEGLEGRGSTAKRTIGMDGFGGWKGSDDGRHVGL